MNIGDITSLNAFRRPRADAVVDVATGRRISFRALDERVNRFAHSLRRELGLDQGDRVAILSRNCIEYAEIFFAAAKSGTVAQPLNWRLSPDEMARILRDGDPTAVIFHQEFSKEVNELQQKVDVPTWVSFRPGEPSMYEDIVARGSPEEPEWTSKIGDQDPFFILYTGGTTGTPKGVLHSHRSAFMSMINQTVAERVAPTDVYMLLGQMFHIPVVLAMNYLYHGCPLVLMNFEPRTTLEVIEQEKVSAFLGITTMLNYMMAVPDFHRFDLSSLRIIQYGGGPMPETVVRQAMESFPCDLMQGYGQTEGGTMTFLAPQVHRDALAGIAPHRLRSCGREAHLTRVRIVNEDGSPTPRDGKAVGEIVVKSEANMLGYWRKPELTAETIKDGWMRTGDLASWDDDGFVYIVDRAKDMIISGGENIYPAQVEEAIYKHPAVLEAAVIGVPDDVWGEAVKAIVVLKPGMKATAEEIMEVTRKYLASYMKPKSVDFVDSLPKGPTNKVLKRELRRAYWEGRDRQV